MLDLFSGYLAFYCDKWVYNWLNNCFISNLVGDFEKGGLQKVSI